MPVRPDQIKLRRRDSIRRRRRKSKSLFNFFLVALVALGGYWGYQWAVNRPARLPQKNLVILGFDGADLRFIQDYWEDLPNLQRLARMGHMGNLETVFPPETAVTWSSFAVGAGPGVHGIFGSLRRPWGTYLISPESFLNREDPRFLWGFARKRPRFSLNRAAEAFWDVTSRHKIPATLIQVPVTFPASKTPATTCLCGSCPADVSGNRITYHHFSTSYRGEIKETTMGGKLVPLSWEDGWYRGTVTGPLDLAVKDKIKGLKDGRFAVQLERMKVQLALWLSDRTSPTLLSDQARHRLTLARLAADLRSESTEMYEKHLPILESLREILADPKSAEAKALLGKVSQTSKSDLEEKINDCKTAEDILLDQQRDLEEKPGLPPSVTTQVRFLPMDEHSVDVDFGGKRDTLFLERWSQWFNITFKIAPLFRIRGVTRFYLKSATPELEVYMHSIEMDPEQPPVPISNPRGFARELAESDDVGLFRTSGWAAETHGLRDGKLDEKAFMDDLLEQARIREVITLYAYENKKPNLLVSVFSETNRVAHMMYRLIDASHPGHDADSAARFGDAIKQVYMHMDRVVGRMLDRIDENTVLFVISGHGFRSFRYTVNLNTWLVEQGYMTLKETQYGPETRSLQQLTIGRSFFDEVDWSQTKAYSLGPGQIYINLCGREPEGIVDPSEYDNVCEDIRAGLLRLTDQREGHYGEPVVGRVGIRKEIWRGPFVEGITDAPDLQVGLEDGYHVGWQTSLGGIPPNTIEDNTEKWSGDHSSVSPDLVPGILFCNRPIKATTPSLVDLAPTVLAYFNLPIPPTMEGKILELQLWATP